MLISTLVNKQVYNINTAVDLGHALKFTYNGDHINYIITDKGFSFSTKDIISINENITCSSHIDESQLCYKQFPHKMVKIINEQGKFIGNLKDILLKRDFSILKLITDKKNFKSFEIKSYSNDILVLKTKNNKDNSTNTQKDNTRTINEQKIDEVQKIQQMSPSINNIPQVIANYDFLLGRRLIKNILSKSGELLFQENIILNKKDIEKAKAVGKLVQLTLYSVQQ